MFLISPSCAVSFPNQCVKTNSNSHPRDISAIRIDDKGAMERMGVHVFGLHLTKKVAGYLLAYTGYALALVAGRVVLRFFGV